MLATFGEVILTGNLSEENSCQYFIDPCIYGEYSILWLYWIRVETVSLKPLSCIDFFPYNTKLL